MTLPLSETDTPEVEKRRFENLHTEEGAHLDTHTERYGSLTQHCHVGLTL